MPIIYLSPSTQEWNPYITGSGSEELSPFNYKLYKFPVRTLLAPTGEFLFKAFFSDFSLNQQLRFLRLLLSIQEKRQIGEQNSCFLKNIGIGFIQSMAF